MTESRAPRADTRTIPQRAPVYRSNITGQIVSQAERIAAARARVSADKLRGVTTAPWIVELAKQSA